MPSLTQWLSFSLHNLGPMTTTFTAAPSCATPTDPLIVVADDTFSSRGGSPKCEDQVWEDYPEGCWPSAREANSRKTAATEGQTLTDRVEMLPYFSPGTECPAGWTTAGAVAKPTATADDAGRTTEPALVPVGSGLYAGQNYSMVSKGDGYWHEDQVLAHALEPGETLALCCPSGYQGDTQGICRSSAGVATEMGFSTVCWLQGQGPSYPPIWTTFRADFADIFFPNETATAYSIVRPVTLVHGPADAAAATTAAATPATGASAGGAGPTETPSAGTRNVLGSGVSLRFFGGLVAGLVGSGFVI